MDDIDGISFENAKQALKTIDALKKRSPVFQFKIINKLFHDAKSCSDKSNDIEQAMGVFRKWMANYHELKLKNVKYPFLSLQTMEKYKQKFDDTRFYEIYSQSGGKHDKLHYHPIDVSKPKHYDWYSYRQHYIDVVTRKNKIFLEKDWFYNDMPNKQHLRLIALGYSPFPKLI